MQYFNEDHDEQNFVNVQNTLLAQTLEDLKNFYENAYKSSELGEAIYYARKTTIYESLSLKRFKRAYWRIVEAQKAIGSYDSYLNLFYAVFGDNAEIVITKTKKHLRFDIIAKEFDYFPWHTLNDDYVVTKSGKQINFKKIILPISLKDLLSLLRKSSVHGAFIDIHINENN